MLERVGSGPHSSRPRPPEPSSRLRTAASWSGEARWEADAIAISSVVRSSRDERERLERLRRGAQVRDLVGVARLSTTAVAHGDGVHQVRRLDDLAART